MKFLIDDEFKFALGWNPKCGNTHLKKVWYYLHNDNNPLLHRYNDQYNKIRPIPINYTILIVVRNPYERLVSGFLDRLKKGNAPRTKWPENFKELTFENYVNELVKENWKVVDQVHFQKQVSDQFPNNFKQYKNVYIQDLNSVTYSLLEKIFKKNIPSEILTFRGDHQNNRQRITYKYPKLAYKIPIDNFIDNVPYFEDFYNKEIYDKVTKYFKDDLDFFKKYNLNYDIQYREEIMNYKTHFTSIYTNKVWGGNGQNPLSGPGSSLSGTTQIRSYLSTLCDKYSIESIADLGCGDLTWMSTLDVFNTKKYTGVDVVDVLIEKHKTTYPNKSFLCLDLIYDELPDADLAIVRDVVFHLQNKDVLVLLNKLKKYKYVCITSNNCKQNLELSGRYTPRNLTIEPFNLKPIETIPEPQWNREILVLKHF